MPEEIIMIAKEVSNIGPWAAALLIVYILYKAGVLQSLASRMRGNGEGHETRIDILEAESEGRESQESRIHKLETNDIKHLEADIIGIRSDVRRIFDRLDEHGNRLTRIETKMNGK